jgi:uncharacterized protein YdeI (YjbR/CyaY-like superfamily)
MIIHKELPVIAFKDGAEFQYWLSQNYSLKKGFWLQFYKKNSGAETITYPESVDIALCYGWIDGLKNIYDDLSYLIRFTPRHKKSIWSQVNVTKVERLILDQRMQPSGMKLVDEAKINGSWGKAYVGQSKMKIPKDFLIELAKYPELESVFDCYNKSQKYHIGFVLSQIIEPTKRQVKIKNLIQKIK